MNRDSAYRSHRLYAEWPSPRNKLRWGEQIRAMLEKEPELTVDELTRRTRAPNGFVRTVRLKWLERRAAAAAKSGVALLLVLLASCALQSRVGPPVGHRREVCDEPDGGRYLGLVLAGDAIFPCPPGAP